MNNPLRNEPNLQSTYPHHKHIPPNIKHNRIPAQATFTRSNFDMLIREIETLLKKSETNLYAKYEK